MRDIPLEQIQHRLRIENPWWVPPHQIPDLFSRHRARPYLQILYPLIVQTEVRRAVILMGPRRVGKTFLLHHAIQRLLDEKQCAPHRICYVSVDHPLYVGCSLERLLEIFASASKIDLETEECFVFFDEIQYLKRWEVHLKTLVDRYPNLKVIASGSAAAALRLKSDESGAGRFTDFHLPPLTFHEYLTLRGDEDLVDLQKEFGEWRVLPEELTLLNERFIHYLNFGGYPEVVLSEEIQANPGRFIRSDIIDKVLLRDLPSLYGITDIQELNSLFTTLAYNTAQEVSLEQLSQRSTVSKPTIKKYIEYLQAAFLIRTVHRVDRTGRHFKRANFFKVYLTNPSLRAALFSPVEADDQATGALVETAVFAQWFQQDQDSHYARWDKGEIDLVHLALPHRDGWAVEVKWSDRFFQRPELLREAIGFCVQNEIASLVVTTRTQNQRTMRQGIELEFVPASLYCLLVGYNIIAGKSFRGKPPGH